MLKDRTLTIRGHTFYVELKPVEDRADIIDPSQGYAVVASISPINKHEDRQLELLLRKAGRAVLRHRDTIAELTKKQGIQLYLSEGAAKMEAPAPASPRWLKKKR